MKIIKQSHQLLPDMADLSKQIEVRARLCYQSGDKITDTSHEKFVAGIIKNGHNSCLEMARITVRDASCCEFILTSKFIESSYHEGYLYHSGSIRAWRETSNLPIGFKSLLHVKYPTFFENPYSKGIPRLYSDYTIYEYPEDGPDYMLHKYQAAKFITNRAMSHEIVRHRNNCSFLQESQRYVSYDKPGGIEFIRPIGFDNWGEVCQDRFWHTCSDAELNYKYDRQDGLTPQQARNNLPNSTKTEIIVYASLKEWMHIFHLRTRGGADPQMIALMTPVLEEFRAVYPGRFDTLTPSVAGKLKKF